MQFEVWHLWHQYDAFGQVKLLGRLGVVIGVGWEELGVGVVLGHFEESFFLRFYDKYVDDLGGAIILSTVFFCHDKVPPFLL